MRLKKRVIVIALLLGLVTVGLLYNFITNLEEPPVPVIETSRVVIAINTIPENTRITTDMITTTDIPVGADHPDVVRSVDEIVGFITKGEIITGEQILKSRIAFDQLDTNLAYLIPENMRAITISIDEVSGVAGYVSAGDKIDILATFDNEGISENPITITQFQNIEVIRKGTNPVGNSEAAEANRGLTNTITLLVTPEQSEVIAFTYIYGNIHITLRNPLDGEAVNLDEFGIDNFEDWRGR